MEFASAPAGRDCCTTAERGLLGGVATLTVASAAAAAEVVCSESGCTTTTAGLTVFFLAAFCLFLSSVPNPSALHNACSSVSSCSWVRCFNSSL